MFHIYSVSITGFYCENKNVVRMFCVNLSLKLATHSADGSGYLRLFSESCQSFTFIDLQNSDLVIVMHDSITCSLFFSQSWVKFCINRLESCFLMTGPPTPSHN